MDQLIMELPANHRFDPWRDDYREEASIIRGYYERSSSSPSWPPGRSSKTKTWSWSLLVGLPSHWVSDDAWTRKVMDYRYIVTVRSRVLLVDLLLAFYVPDSIASFDVFHITLGERQLLGTYRRGKSSNPDSGLDFEEDFEEDLERILAASHELPDATLPKGRSTTIVVGGVIYRRVVLFQPALWSKELTSNIYLGMDHAANILYEIASCADGDVLPRIPTEKRWYLHRDNIYHSGSHRHSYHNSAPPQLIPEEKLLPEEDLIPSRRELSYNTIVMIRDDLGGYNML